MGGGDSKIFLRKILLLTDNNIVECSQGVLPLGDGGGLRKHALFLFILAFSRAGLSRVKGMSAMGGPWFAVLYCCHGQ